MRLLIFIFIYGISIIWSTRIGEAAQGDKIKDSKSNFQIYYDDNKIPVRIESDRNYDGIIDLWIIYKSGGRRLSEIDSNFDGRPDVYSYFEYGERVRFEMDRDYDGIVDEVRHYKNNHLIKLERRKNGRLETVFDIGHHYHKILLQKKNTHQDK